MTSSVVIRDGVDPPFSFQEHTAQFVSQGVSGKQQVRDPLTGEPLGTVAVVASSLGRAILYIDPGLGKSRIAIESAARLPIDFGRGDLILVLCSKKALNTWRREWSKWTTLDAQQVSIVEGPAEKRMRQWLRVRHGARVFVATYQSAANDWNGLPKDLTGRIKLAIADECKLWINRKTKNFRFWQPIFHKIPYVILMDGTIVKKGPQDLWTFYNLIKPKVFTSYWKWVNTFCLVVEGPFGKEIVGPKNTAGFANLMSHTLIRLNDQDPVVKAARPPLIRDFKLVEMSDEQKALYDQLTEELCAITPSGEVVATPSILGLTTKQRQILICPKILDSKMGYGSAIEHLVEEMDPESGGDPHVVIFTPFTSAIPYISAAIQEAPAGHPEPFVLKGGTDSVRVGQIERAFNADTPDARRRAIICSVGFAESFELWTAKQCFFIGYDWTQITNYQAEKRLQRLITPHPILSWYYRYMHTVDDVILEQLNSNVINVRISFQDYISALERTRTRTRTLG